MKKTVELGYKEVMFNYDLSRLKWVSGVTNKVETMLLFQKPADLGQVDAMNYCGFGLK
jgi:hypothetical protein